MRYQDHPTWKMLEQGKKVLKHLMGDINITINQVPNFMREDYEVLYDQINVKHKKLVSLQLELENKINQHD